VFTRAFDISQRAVSNRLVKHTHTDTKVSTGLLFRTITSLCQTVNYIRIQIDILFKQEPTLTGS